MYEQKPPSTFPFYPPYRRKLSLTIGPAAKMRVLAEPLPRVDKIKRGDACIVCYISYNRHHLLLECVETTLQSLEPGDLLVVIDNGSSPSISQVQIQTMYSHCNKVEVDLLVVRQDTNFGIGSALCCLYSMMSGSSVLDTSIYSWLCILSDDDYFTSCFSERVRPLLSSSSDHAVITWDFDYIKHADKSLLKRVKHHNGTDDITLYNPNLRSLLTLYPYIETSNPITSDRECSLALQLHMSATLYNVSDFCMYIKSLPCFLPGPLPDADLLFLMLDTEKSAIHVPCSASVIGVGENYGIGPNPLILEKNCLPTHQIPGLATVQKYIAYTFIESCLLRDMNVPSSVFLLLSRLHLSALRSARLSSFKSNGLRLSLSITYRALVDCFMSLLYLFNYFMPPNRISFDYSD